MPTVQQTTELPVKPAATTYDIPASDRLNRFKSSDFFAQLRKNTRIFAFFFGYLKPYRSKVFIIVLSRFLSAPLAVLSAVVTKFMIDEVVLDEYKTLEQKVQLFFITIGIQTLLWVILIIKKEIIFGVIEWFLDLRITIDIMRDFYDHEQSLDLTFHRSRAVGEHMYRTAEDMTDNDIGYQRGGLLGMITYDWMEAINIIWEVLLASALFALLDPMLGFIVVIYLVPKLIGIHKFNTWYKNINYQNREIQQERFAVERDIIAGMKTFKIMGRTRFASNRFVQIMTYAQRIYYKSQFARSIGEGFFVWFFQKIIYDRGVHLYVFANVLMGNMSLGSLVLVQTLLGRVTKPLETLVQLVQRFRQRLVPAERMIETLSIKPTIVEKKDGFRFQEVKGEITFKEVTFGYDPGNLLLNKVSFTVKPGERVAFVGPSGVGKSTVFNLTLRLYDTMQGSVLIDGHDIRDIRLKSYLDRIGVILQETFLFAGSVSDNIRFGKPLATKEEIEQAIHLAELDAYIAGAPEGLDTFLGEGTKLSGGQKQRMGIARALVRSPSMFIMDEPTAHLDVIAETNIFKTIEAVTRGVTTLIISHRIAPILFVDKLIVLTPGGVEAMGSHQELLKISPTYQALWKVQQGEAQL